MRNRVLIVTWAVFVALSAFAQEGTDKLKSSSDKAQEVFDGSLNRSPSDPSRVDKPADVTPEYPGGIKAMHKFIRKNFKYYTSSPREGKVYVQFMIEKDGSLTDVVVRSGVSPVVDEEAIRMVKAMPPWKPGTINGVPVRCQFMLPITTTKE